MSTNESSSSGFDIWRLLIAGIVGVAIVGSLILISMAVSGSAVAEGSEPERVNVLANSDNECVICHERTTPGIVAAVWPQHHGRRRSGLPGLPRSRRRLSRGAWSTRAPYVLNSANHGHVRRTATKTEVAQFNQSRHALPAYVAYAGHRTDLAEAHLADVRGHPRRLRSRRTRCRNALYELEGPAITAFACESCHNVGKPAADGSVGQCQKCHLRHEFSLEQVRKPETCNHCHIGPDHPQWEIYQESPHGIAYCHGGDDWNWEAEPGTLT